MADAGDVGGDLNGVRQAGASDFAQSGIGLLRRLRVYANANAALFRASLQRGRLRFGANLFASGSYELRKRRHGSPSNELDFTSLSTGAELRAAACRGVHLKKGYSCDTGAPDNKPRTTTSEQIITFWSKR